MKNRVFRLAVLSFTSVLGLSACVSTSVMNSGYQPIDFAVSGAERATCYAYAGDVKYHFTAPGRLNARKSSETLRVTCMSGNRTVDLNLPANVNEKPVWSGSSGVASGYDTRALYSYPSFVKVDFGAFSVPAVSSMTLQEDSVEDGGETAVAPSMLPDLPAERASHADPIPVTVRPAKAEPEKKDGFASLLGKLGATEPEAGDPEDADIVEIKPANGPVSLSRPHKQQ